MFKKIIIAVGILGIVSIIGGVFLVKYEKERFQPKSRSDIKVVNLSKPSDSKTVVFETGLVAISFGLNDFETNLRQWIKKHPHIKSDQELLSFIEDESESKDKIEIEISNVTDELRSRIEYRVADLLETGKYTLYDKSKNVYLNKIKVETYSYICGPLCGSGGRKYILPDDNTVFFQVMDWIS
jgi:hypothetical protein